MSRIDLMPGRHDGDRRDRRARSGRRRCPSSALRRGGRRRCRRSRTPRCRRARRGASWPPPSWRRCGRSRRATARSRVVALCTSVAVASCSSCVGVEADVARPVEHGDRRRHRAVRADDRLDLGRHLDVGRVRHPVADDRRLERDDRSSRRERVGDLVGRHVDGGAHPHRRERGGDRLARLLAQVGDVGRASCPRSGSARARAPRRR